MIKYKLNCKSKYCSEENDFDGWFKSIEAYENQKHQGLINCPICGSDKVVKSLTTPSLKTTKSQTSEDQNINNKTFTSSKNFIATENLDIMPTLLRTLKKEVQKNSSFVGNKFVSQVRSMKEGKIEEKPIHGYGTNKEIQELKDEGIDVINIPWIADDH